MREHRKNFRVEWNSQAKIYDCHGRFDRQCIVSNFSNGGAKILVPESGGLPDEFILRISPRCRLQKCHVIWRSKDGVGVEFTDSAKDASDLSIGGRKRAPDKTTSAAPLPAMTNFLITS